MPCYIAAGGGQGGVPCSHLSLTVRPLFAVPRQRASGVKVISWRGREVFMLQGLPSSPKEDGLLSDSVTGAYITCGHIVACCLCWGGGGGSSTDGSISTE